MLRKFAMFLCIVGMALLPVVGLPIVLPLLFIDHQCFVGCSWMPTGDRNDHDYMDFIGGIFFLCLGLSIWLTLKIADWRP